MLHLLLSTYFLQQKEKAKKTAEEGREKKLVRTERKKINRVRE